MNQDFCCYFLNSKDFFRKKEKKEIDKLFYNWYKFDKLKSCVGIVPFNWFPFTDLLKENSEKSDENVFTKKIKEMKMFLQSS